MPKIPYLKMHSEPAAIPVDLATELAAVVIEWGRFETGIITDTQEMMRYPNIQALESSPPRSFSKRIELWKHCIHALFDIQFYRNVAAEICSKGKTVSHFRNRLVHGIWSPVDGTNGLYTVTGMKNPKALPEQIHADAQYVGAVHRDIRAVSDAFFEFRVNRMLHAHQGRLQARVELKPE